MEGKQLHFLIPMFPAYNLSWIHFQEDTSCELLPFSSRSLLF
jgi:hypothetical protein